MKSLINGVLFGIGTLFIYGVFLFAWNATPTGSLDSDLFASSGDVITLTKWNSLMKSVKRESVPTTDTAAFDINCEWKATLEGFPNTGQTSILESLGVLNDGSKIWFMGTAYRYYINNGSKSAIRRDGSAATNNVTGIWKKCAY